VYFNVNYVFLKQKMHLLVVELYIYQNVRWNNKKSLVYLIFVIFLPLRTTHFIEPQRGVVFNFFIFLVLHRFGH
jgi:hypothetical protein